MTEDPSEKRELQQHFSTGSAKARMVGGKLVIPSVLDGDGEVREVWSTPESKMTLTLDQARYLRAFEKGEDLGKVLVEIQRTEEWAGRFLKRRAVQEHLRQKERLTELEQVAGPVWTKVKAVEGVTGEWKPDDAQISCLKILKDINFPKAGTSINIQNNLLTMPAMSTEQEAILREMGDRLADVEAAVVVEGRAA